MNKLMNLESLTLLGLCVLGCLSDFNRIDVPYWIFFSIGFVYAVLKMSDSAILKGGISKPTPPDPDPNDGDKRGGISKPTKKKP